MIIENSSNPRLRIFCAIFPETSLKISVVSLFLGPKPAIRIFFAGMNPSVLTIDIVDELCSKHPHVKENIQQNHEIVVDNPKIIPYLRKKELIDDNWIETAFNKFVDKIDTDLLMS